MRLSGTLGDDNAADNRTGGERQWQGHDFAEAKDGNGKGNDR